MDPGRLREPITVQKETHDEDAHHSPTRSTSWADDFDARAAVELDNQRTETVAGRENPRQIATFTVRRRDGYTENKRIVWDGMIFEISAIRPADEMRTFLEINAVYSGTTV